jgi:hypothetical protein
MMPPMVNSGCPFSTGTIESTSISADVANATSVNPIAVSLSPATWAIVRALSTVKLPPAAIMTIPSRQSPSDFHTGAFA